MKKIMSVFLLVLTVILLVACTNNETSQTETEDQNKLEIYTTVYPLQYFTERIGGEYVNVSSIYPPGSNEHTFEPTQKDMISLADADIFFYVGLGLEGFVESAKETLASENVKFVATSENISEEKLEVSIGHSYEETLEEEHNEHEEEGSHEEHEEGTHVEHEEGTHEEHEEGTHEEHEEGTHEEHEEESHDEHAHGEFDPHVWLSPKLSQDLALTIKNELVTAMPENEELFNENYEKLKEELVALDADFKKLVADAKTKTFFVSHSAFGYIAGEYGLIQVPIAGLNSQSEPSQQQLIEIVDLAQELNVKYILLEQNVSSELTSIIQEEIGAEALTLNNLSVLTEEDIEQNETYFTLMQKNIDTLEKALNP